MQQPNVKRVRLLKVERKGGLAVPQASEGCSVRPLCSPDCRGNLQLSYLLQELDGGGGGHKRMNVPEDLKPVWSGCLAA